MDEYIKREDAIGIVKEIMDDRESRRYSNPFTMIIDSIEGVPAADVVEVVRCECCKYYDGDYCDRHEVMTEQFPDYYCADGERGKYNG